MTAVEQTEIQEQEVTQEVDYKALYEDLKPKFESVLAKKDELLGETKKAKADRTAAEQEAKRVADEKALKDGEYEKLWKTAKEEKESLAKEIQNLKHSNRQEKIQVSAMRISQDLSEGDNVELLSDFVMRNLDKLADESGALSADVLEDVKKEFANNNKYKSLLRQSKASGGNAQGNASGKAMQIQTLSRSEFSKLNPKAQSDFALKIRSGSATLTD